jgi:hypothetical protein
MMKFLLLVLLVLSSTLALAQEKPSPWGMNYFSFWEGHSLDDGKTAKNELGRRLDDGLQLFNLISTTYKLNDRIGIDLQTRIEHIPMTFRGDFKNGKDTEPSWRFQGLRIGISGKLAAGEKWSLRGAFNTDIPELNGRDASFRKTILTPGLFSGLNYQIDDRWSVYAILSPRLFFYSDDNAVEPEWRESGRDPGEKPRAILAASPSINYAINDKTGMRAGLDLSFRQFIESDPTFLKRWPTSASIGPTFIINKHLNIWTYVQTWPFDGKKMHIETTSWGAWINGIIF